MLKKLLLLVVMSAFPLLAFGQSGTLTGTVMDSDTGEPLPGATVFLSDIGQGSPTDLNGEYEITNIPYGTYEAVVSFVGYVTIRQTIEIDASRVEQDFRLRFDAVGLDDVVVSGYAPQLKREVTGSVSTVSAAEIADVPLQNTEGLLQGRAAGVNITATSGEPGGAFRVQIRGNGSINAASEPLFIVDGVPVSFSQSPGNASNSPLNALNPDDIESIEVLKDASSAAIYGSQAAAGVVLITTKRGSEGRTQISASVQAGTRFSANRVDYLGRDAYLDYLGEAFSIATGQSFEDARANRANAMRSEFGSPLAEEDLPGEPGSEERQAFLDQGLDLADTNWQEFVYDQGATQKYNVSVTGGSGDTNFRLAGGYEDTQGMVFDSEFTRLNLRTNLDHRFNDRFTTGITFNTSRYTRFGICQDGNFINCPPSQAMFEPPFSFPYLADGDYNPNTNFGINANPAVIKDEVEREVIFLSILANATADFRINDWLSVRGLVGIDYRDTDDRRHETVIARPAEQGFTSQDFRRVENSIANLVFNANYTFDDVHNVSGFIGTEYRRDYNQRIGLTGEGFPGTFFSALNASTTPTRANGFNTEYRFAGYFGNLKYNYDQKYFLSFTGRYDGSSRFGADTRWGFFPSISGAWTITQEDFFNVSYIDDLKLRVGFGTTGNANFPNDFAARGLYSAIGSYQAQTGLTPTQLANVNLSWEEAQELNIGLDYAFLEGRISGAIDVYRKDTKDLLFDRPLPTDSGFGSITENIGSVRNEGIEFDIQSINVNTADFTWSTRFNIAFMRNEVLELPNGETIDENDFLGEIAEGQPLGQIRAIRWAGVNPADGRPMWYDADGNITYNPDQTTDSFKYKDGVANQVGGFGNTLSYKAFTLDTFFQFSFGQWAFANTDWFFTRTPNFLMNLDEMLLDRWREPGDLTYIPRAALNGAAYQETADFRTQTGTHAVYNASYIRLKNVTLSYNAPRAVTETIGVSNLRLFVTGVNLHTWTAWPFYDPEVAFDDTDIFNNITIASYPTARQVNAGIELQF